MKHKDNSLINIWLSDLVKKGIIGRIYSKELGKGNTPAVYYLATANKTVADHLNIKQASLDYVYKEKLRSEQFRARQMILADMNLDLIEEVAGGKGKLAFFTKVDLIPHKYLIHPLPDVYIALRKGRKVKRYFVEVIDPKYPVFAIKNKVQNYIKYFQSKEFEDITSHPFPAVLIICQNEPIKSRFMKCITKQRDTDYLEGLSFYVRSTLDTSWEKV